MPLPEKLLMEPPLAVTSSTVKSVEASDKVKVMVAVSPTPSSSLFVVIATVGGVVSLVSTVMETEPALVLALPAASVNLLESTETTPSVVLLAVGVKVAV